MAEVGSYIHIRNVRTGETRIDEAYASAEVTRLSFPTGLIVDMDGKREHVVEAITTDPRPPWENRKRGEK